MNSLRIVRSVAANTIRESLRNKILYNIVFVGLGVILFAVSLGDWSVFARVQVMQDFGLATMSLTGLLLSVFIGVGLLGREVSTKTIYLVVTKPVGRASFVIGKFLGLLVTLFLNFLLLAVVFWIAILYMGGKPHAALLSAVLLIWVEMAVMIAAAIFFSTFSTGPVFAAILTAAFYVGGHLNDLVSIELLEGSQAWMADLLKIVYFVLPNLEHFNVRTAIVYGLALPPNYVPFALLYGTLYVTLLMFFSCVAFAKRDL
jgi:Cu-processing system permease protein